MASFFGGGFPGGFGGFPGGFGGGDDSKHYFSKRKFVKSIFIWKIFVHRKYSYFIVFAKIS